MQKYVIAGLLRFFIQLKPNWSKMDVIILIEELLHIQVYIVQTDHYVRPLLSKFIYRNKVGGAISAACFHQKWISSSK